MRRCCSVALAARSGRHPALDRFRRSAPRGPGSERRDRRARRAPLHPSGPQSPSPWVRGARCSSADIRCDPRCRLPRPLADGRPHRLGLRGSRPPQQRPCAEGPDQADVLPGRLAVSLPLRRSLRRPGLPELGLCRGGLSRRGARARLLHRDRVRGAQARRSVRVYHQEPVGPHARSRTGATVAVPWRGGR